MFGVPSLLLKQLYNRGSLRNTQNGVAFGIKNRLSDTQITQIYSVSVGGTAIDLQHIQIDLGDQQLPATSVSTTQPIDFPLRRTLDILCHSNPLAQSSHTIEIAFETNNFGKLVLKIDDHLQIKNTEDLTKIPRNETDDYSPEAIKARQAYTENYTGKKLEHISKYSFDPHITAGNCEHFIGVAQVPIGIAGPILINGEHAQGEFLIPMATAEGTLVASYNRGIKVLNACGGVTCTVCDDAMQRAPVFGFENARGARDFIAWVKQNMPIIAQQAESTTSIGKLKYIDHYIASKFAYLRFNFFTGDAAGQNMVGRATFAACSWILDNYNGQKIESFYLESNLATDKKASQVNVMHTRGKRVTAECVIKQDVLKRMMRVDTKQLSYHSQVASIGTILSGANNNGLHSANGITALFIATGQDVANVSESSAGIVYSELTPENDLYMSITIPSLIVATYGGGTSLATQRESLELLDCYGKGKVMKLAEIIAGVVLAGEISLASAISSSDWVSSHEKYGRNR
jgi:hydroxymethylglutaryl-CoA reductase (NADPH)